MAETRINWKIRLQLENRVDRVYVSSEDVPGLWLWGKNQEEVLAAVVPAIKKIFKYNNNLDVDLTPLLNAGTFPDHDVAQQPTEFVMMIANDGELVARGR